MAKKFIIITTARSGSQMLCEFLDKQVNIRCELELLGDHKENKFQNLINKTLDVNIENKFRDILGNDNDKFVGNRNKKFIEYLKIWEDVIYSEHFGFKVFFGNHLGTTKLPLEDAITYEAFVKYVKDNNIKIIHLTRDNLLLKYISVLTSRITGRFSVKKNNDVNSISVEVIYNDFIEWRDKIIKEEQSVVNFSNDNSIDYHHVTYEKLIGNNYIKSYKDILSFIGVDPDFFIDIRDTNKQNSKKTNIFTIRYKVSNLDQLIEEATKANDTELLDVINVELSKMGEI